MPPCQHAMCDFMIDYSIPVIPICILDCIHSRRVFNLYPSMLTHIPHHHTNIKTLKHQNNHLTIFTTCYLPQPRQTTTLKPTTTTPLCHNTMSSPSRPNDFGSDLWVRDSHTQTRVSNKQSFIIPLHGANPIQIPKPSYLLTTMNAAPYIRPRPLRRPARHKTLQCGKRVGQEEC